MTYPRVHLADMLRAAMRLRAMWPTVGFMP